MNKNVTIIGIPIDLGAENLGVDLGANAFRYIGLSQKLEEIGFRITDKGNIVCNSREKLALGNPKLKYLDEILRISEEIAHAVDTSTQANEKVIVLGGDHSVNLGAVSGASKALDGDLGLIYLDAHGDMNTDKTTLTGNIHGMHVASLLGFGAQELKTVYTDKVKIEKKNFLHIGAQDLDPGEEALIKNENLNAFTMLDFLTKGLLSLFVTIETLQKQVKHVWVSLDLDVIDSVYAPGAGMPNSGGGFTYREIAAITKFIGEHCHVVGLDIVEYNPLNDIKHKTAALSIELIVKLLGSDYSWYTGYMDKNKIE